MDLSLSSFAPCSLARLSTYSLYRAFSFERLGFLLSTARVTTFSFSLPLPSRSSQARLPFVQVTSASSVLVSLTCCGLGSHSLENLLGRICFLPSRTVRSGRLIVSRLSRFSVSRGSCGAVLACREIYQNLKICQQCFEEKICIFSQQLENLINSNTLCMMKIFQLFANCVIYLRSCVSEVSGSRFFECFSFNFGSKKVNFHL